MVTGLLQSSVAVAVPVLLGSVEAEQSIVVSAGQLITGGVVSVTLMVCTQLEELPQASVAVQVRVMVWLPGQLPGTVLSVKVTTGAGSQLSVAVALPVLLGSVEAEQSIVVSAGQLITGAVVSTTLMVCTQLESLPQLSVAVQVRVMV